MTTYEAKRATAVVVGGVSALVCASAAYFWVKGKNSVKQEKSSSPVCSSSTVDQQQQSVSSQLEKFDGNLSSSSSGGDLSSTSATSRKMLMSNNPRGGRKNYRAIKKRQDFSPPIKATTGLVMQPRQQTDAELNAARLAAEFSSKMKFSVVNAGGHLSSPEEGELVNSMMLMDESLPSPSPKGQGAESPSLACDGRSEGSQDSGKGESTALTSSVSPMEELIEVPPMYEFEVPQDIVGLIIGRKGQTIKWFTDSSGAQIVIRRHFSSDRHKICTIEGSREQINKCLRLIRRKFPPSRFPELKLTPILPPPIASPRTAVSDSIIRLNLPRGVKFEAVVSSLVDVGHFFLQQPTHPAFPSLARLDQCMGQVYSQPFAIPGLPRPIDAGVICAAPVLGGWYRAQTMESFDDTDDVLVKFVDYGGYSKIQAADLRQIRSDLMALPFQASECCLANVKPINESEGWSPDAIALFEECTHGKIVEALVAGATAENVNVVDLFVAEASTENEEPMTLSRLLVDAGLAQWIGDEEASNVFA